MRRSRSRSRSPRRIKRRQSDAENDSGRHRNRDRPDREPEERRRRSDKEGRRGSELSDRPHWERRERNRERSLDGDSGEEQVTGRRDWQNERRRDSWSGDQEQRNLSHGRRGRVGSWREVGTDSRGLDTDTRVRTHSNLVEQSGHRRWESDDHTGHQQRQERGDRRERRRPSNEDEMEEGRALNLNPTDVPKGDSYFLHDDRSIGGRGKFSSRRPRFPSDSTPFKWGHDMFDRLYGEEKTPPPDMDEFAPDTRTRSVVNRVERESERSERDPQGSEQHDRSCFNPNIKKWGHDKYHQLYGEGSNPPPPDSDTEIRTNRKRSTVSKADLSLARGRDRIEL